MAIDEETMKQIKKMATSNTPEKKKPKPESKVSISKDDFDALVLMAKGQDPNNVTDKSDQYPVGHKPTKLDQHPKPTLGEEIEKEKEADISSSDIPTIETRKKGKITRTTTSDEGDYGDLASRPTVLYFDTDRTCSLVNVKVKNDGSVQIDERLFDFTKGQPSILRLGGKGRSKGQPFYVVKYDNMNPLDVAMYPKSVPAPEQATRLVELKTLETLSAIAGGKMKKGPLIILMIAAFFGGIVVKLMLGIFGVW